MEKRTHSCGALRLEDVGRRVVLMGWVRTRRDHGHVVFLDLWDREGVTQIVADPQTAAAAYDVARELRDEYVVAVVGTVKARPGGTENPALATGQVEVAAERIEVFNTTSPLPYPVEDAPHVDETVRFRYRYLDLRRAAMQRNFRLRHRVLKGLRDALDAEGFLEVETPVLTRSTPEGARDYLVPSRIHPGQFYALPQSPQQMKQLLMVAGMDRYYQVARCFRDEDLRADRQPEFTQLDLEMSFVDQEAVLELMEAVVVKVVSDVAPDKQMPTPFPRMTHAEAVARYGTDKPDLRFGLSFVDCTKILGAGDVRIFQAAVEAGGVVKGFCVPGAGATPETELETLQTLSRELGAQGVIWMRVEDDSVAAPVARHLSGEEQRALIEAFGAEGGDLLMMVADAPEIVNRVLDALRREMGDRLGLVDPDTLTFAWITDFPLFKWDDEEQRWDAEHHPFTSPKPEDLPLLASDPGAVRASCYDLVCNGWELASGSIRIHERALQARILDLLDYAPDEAEAAFGHLMEAFEYGAPPHGGIALGIDRLVAILAGSDTIRDVIAFPKTRQATDLTMRAPAHVEKAQLDDIHVRIVMPRKRPVRVSAGEEN